MIFSYALSTCQVKPVASMVRKVSSRLHSETIRLSVGLEDVNDLIADLEQAFAATK